MGRLGRWVDSSRLLWFAALAAGCSDDTGSAPADESSSSASTIGEGESSNGSVSVASDPDPDSTSVGETSSAEASVTAESSSGNETDVVPSGGAVDVLFVVGNTATMGPEQAKLAAGIAAFADTLDAAALDWRIGVTTTDNGHPLCTASSPEGGKLRASSCRSRLGEFVYGPQPIDATSEACLDVCAHDSITVEPTPTDVDPEPKQRQWIETIGGVSNVGEGVPTGEALACLMPQGIDGCGFQQPLESMLKAVLRSSTRSEGQYGFLREGVLKAIVIVTEEADCSYATGFVEIFDSEAQGGNEVFWSDPDASGPTRAVCWNAGTVCTGGPGTYDECHAADLGIDGSPVAMADEAVMRPLSRYADLLGDTGEVYLAAIDGVPIGYEDGAVDMVFEDSDDPQEQIDFGIGPGCSNGDESAVPSVRVRELVEQFDGGERNDFSSCEDSYDTALTTIAERIIARQE
jgi:hypothetical protein